MKRFMRIHLARRVTEGMHAPMPETIIYYSIEQKILVDIECDRNRNLRISRGGGERKNIGKIDDVCGSVNFEDASRRVVRHTSNRLVVGREGKEGRG